MSSFRINARLSPPLAAFVEQMVGPNGLYETPSEYIRDLIRRDMERSQVRLAQAAILDGYRDLAEGAVFTSTGDFASDMERLAHHEAEGWK
jgi:antitoxin ParD1/3/4